MLVLVQKADSACGCFFFLCVIYIPYGKYLSNHIKLTKSQWSVTIMELHTCSRWLVEYKRHDIVFLAEAVGRLSKIDILSLSSENRASV